MEAGCKTYGWVKDPKKADKKAYKGIPGTVFREDGAYVEAGENDNPIIQKLANNPKCLWYPWLFVQIKTQMLFKVPPISGVVPNI